MTDVGSRAPHAPADTPLRAMLERRPLPASLGVVDGHAHLGPYSLFHIPRPDIDTMVGVMDRTGVAVTVLSANRGLQQDAHAGNEETLAATRRHPSRVAGYGVVNVWQDPERELDWLTGQTGFVGIKVHPDLHEYPVDGPRYEPVWECAVATGLPVLTHTWNTSSFNDPAQVGRVLARHPDLTVILGHAGVSPAGVASSVDVAERHPGAVLEICGSQLTAPLLEQMVGQLGAARVMFGSDFPFIDQRCSLGRAVGSHLSPTDLAQVLGGTARRVFGHRLTCATAPDRRPAHAH